MKIDLTGRVALVTGASRGIGREIAKALAGAGAKVACVATNEDLLNSLVAEIGNGAIALKCDISKPAEIEATVEKAAEKNTLRRENVELKARLTPSLRRRLLRWSAVVVLLGSTAAALVMWRLRF